MKTDFYLEVGYENFHGDFIDEFIVPLYYGGVRFNDGSATDVGGSIVAKSHYGITDTLYSLYEENKGFTQAWLRFKGYTVGIYSYQDGKWELL